MPINIDDFSSEYPNLVTGLSDSFIQKKLNLAQAKLDASVFKTSEAGQLAYEEIVFSLVAHELALKNRIVGPTGTTPKGNLTSKSVGPKSESYGAIPLTSFSDTYYMSTEYGLDFMRLYSMYYNSGLRTV